MNANDIEERLIRYASSVIRLCEKLPKSPAGRHLAGQLLRCGTSPAANYAEARGAESRPDFTHKISLVLKELQEAAVWLKIIEHSKMADVVRARQETDELCRILGATEKTLRGLRKIKN